MSLQQKVQRRTTTTVLKALQFYIIMIGCVYYGFRKITRTSDKDLKINDTELDLESLKTPQLHNKYMKHLTKFKLMLSRAEGDLYNVKRELWEYYTGKADGSVYAEKAF